MSLLTLGSDIREVRLCGEHLEIISAGEEKADVPLCEISRVVVCGRPRISFAVILELMHRGCPVAFLTSGGRWVGALGRDDHYADRLRRQVEISSNEDACLAFGRRLISAKIRNQRRILLRWAVRRESQGERNRIRARFRGMVRSAERSVSAEELLGIEGNAAAEYFSYLGRYLPEEFRFEKRTRNPPRDAANALLSFCYTVTAGELDSQIRLHGMESSIGFFHRPFRSFPALAWDLLEIFRGPFCDALVLDLFSHHIIRQEHFEKIAPGGAVHLNGAGRRLFFQQYEAKRIAPFRLRGEEKPTNCARQFGEQVRQLLNWLDTGTEPEFFLMP